jgi:hypothetical protein
LQYSASEQFLAEEAPMSDHGFRPTRSSFLAGAGAAMVAAARGADAAPTVQSQLAQAIDPTGRFGAQLDRNEFVLAPPGTDVNVVLHFQSQRQAAETPPATNGATRTTIARRHIVRRLPAVTMQGTPHGLGYPGSCEAQSFGYCLGTQTASRTIGHQFQPTTPPNQASAAWLFAWACYQEKKTGCGGSQALGYLNMLVAHGAPSAQQVPYKPNCAYLNGNQIDTNIASYSGVDRFQIGSFNAFPDVHGQMGTLLPQFKALLRAGHVIAFSGLVAKKYGNPAAAMVNGAFDPQSFIPKSGHGQAIVGYDDSLGHTGAFLVQNSFGTAWPGLPGSGPLLQGRLWWTYESFFGSQYLAAIAYPIAPRPARPLARLSANGSGAPDGWLSEAVRAIGMTGGYALVIEPGFGAAVHLQTATVTPPGQQAQTVQYNNPIRNGFVRIPRTTAFPAGRYAVKLAATTIVEPGSTPEQIAYTGTFTVH